MTKLVSQQPLEPKTIPSADKLEILRKYAQGLLEETRDKAIFFYLLERLRGGKGTTAIVSPAHLLDLSVEKKLGINSKQHCYKIMERLAVKCEEISNNIVGDDFPFVFAINAKRGDYSLIFQSKENMSEQIRSMHQKAGGTSVPSDFVDQFWGHAHSHTYESTPPSVRIYYPTPFFLRDDRETYFRNPRATIHNYKSELSYLNVGEDLKPGFSFVPAGIVSAMLMLIEHFHKNGIRFAVQPVPPGYPNEEQQEDIIVLGTSTSNEMIVKKEQGKLFRSMSEGIVRSANFKKKYSLRTAGNLPLEAQYADDSSDPRKGRKYALLTRYQDISGRRATLISARHGKLVQAVVQQLIRQDDPSMLSLLAQEHGLAPAFPREFQVIFELEADLKQNEVESTIDNIRPIVMVGLESMRSPLLMGRVLDDETNRASRRRDVDG